MSSHDSGHGADRVQRALNQHKREELAKRYGASFIQPDAALPPELEAEWLSHLERFEQGYAAATRITVFAYCGRPPFPAVGEVSDAELPKHLQALFDLLRRNNVHVHFLAGCDDREKYRFITEDLFRQQMDDVRIDGMSCNFIYEEFYPNHEYDARQDARWFLRDLFERDPERMLSLFAGDELYAPNGRRVGLDEVRRRLEDFYARVGSIRRYSIDNDHCTVNEGYATYQADLCWEGSVAGRPGVVEHSGRVMIRLKQGEYYGWKVCSMSVPGV